MRNRRIFGGAQGPPSWWPRGEAWPPPPGAWRARRGRFLRRIGALLLVLFGLVFGAMFLGFVLFGGREGPDQHGQGWDGPPIFGFLLLIGGALLVFRLLRRTAAPVSDLMEATGRLAGGDYSVRVRPHGSPEVRELAQAFNALAQRLERNENERRELIADVTHELRTPLSVIRGAAEGIADGVYPGDAAHMQPIVEEVEVMARLLEDLATISTAEAGQLSLQKEGVRPRELVEESAAAFRPRFEAAGVALVNDVSADLPSFEVDPLRIRQVLANILANALRHTPRGGSVTVAAAVSEDGQRVVLHIDDTGSGIPADQLPYVFERLRKADDSEGSGLGLAIARSLVEAHGGRILAESEVGRGTTITIELPISIT
jgi:two-component system sensor histidine kinase BaeS